MQMRMINFLLLGFCCLFVSQTARAEPVWVDVRSLIEYKLDHIDGDIRIPHDEIVSEIEKKFPDKNTEINLYCLSGGRAGKAKTALEKAGYGNVKNFGGIFDVRKVRNLK